MKMMKICGIFLFNYREFLCGIKDYSIQIIPPPVILKSMQIVRVNEGKTIFIQKPKANKKIES